MSESPWISIIRYKTDIVVIENDSTYHQISRLLGAKPPCLVTFIGKCRKSLFLQRLLGDSSEFRTPCLGYINLQVDRRTTGADYPMLYLNCEFQRDNNFQHNNPTNGVVRKILCPEGRRRSISGKSINNQFYGKVLAPLSSIMCYFAKDLRGIRGIAELLAEQAVQSKIPYDLPNLLPRCLLVVETTQKNFDPYKVEQNLYLRLYEAMRSLKVYESFSDIEADIKNHFYSIHIIGIQKTLKLSAQVHTLRKRLNIFVRESYPERYKNRVLFSFRHIQGFLGPLINHFCSYTNDQFSFISVSRSKGSSIAEFSVHLDELLRILPLREWLWSLAVPLVSSSIILECYPPNGHKFITANLFNSLFADRCLRAIENYTEDRYIKTRFIESIQTSLTDLDSQNLQAADTHRQSLSTLYIYFKELRSYKSCLCCLMRSPEKVLQCGHALCDICIRIFGQKLNKYTYSLASCIFCGASQSTSQFSFIQDTAGLRVLSLDGGGIRGVISLEYLIYLSNELSALGCPLYEYFDYICGTSAGGVTVLGLFLMQWSPEDCLRKFETLAGKTFSNNRKGSTLFLRLQEVLLHYMHGCQGNPSPIEEAFSNDATSPIKMFNPLKTDTKVAVTSATVKDNLPCLFSNYNGYLRPDKIGYALVRAHHPKHDILIGEAASCTTAAPWFLKPKVLDNLGTFQDGALCFPNPLRIALLETSLIWPSKGEPDFALSIGTGITSGTFTPFFFGPQSPSKLGTLSRIINCCKRIFEPEVAWIEFFNQLPPESKSRYHRLNIQLEGPEIRIDDISSISPLKEKVKESILSDLRLVKVKDSIYASMFYFELEDIPCKVNGAFECNGYILCRVDLPKHGREHLYRELVRTSAFFLISGRPIPCVNFIPKSLPPFRRAVRFSANSLADHVHISLRGLTSRPQRISGLPRSLQDIIDLQKLYIPFGRVDHIPQEKDLPKEPLKRRYIDSSS